MTTRLTVIGRKMKNELISKSAERLKKLIKSQLKLSYSRNDDKDSFSRQSFLNEYRIICLSMIRQSGVTTCISELFDVNHDVYVASNIRQVENFQELLFVQNKLESNNKQIKIKYFILKPSNKYISKNAYNGLSKKIKDIFEYNNLEQTGDCNQTRGISISKDAKIWFDLGNGISLQTMPKIIDFINIIDLYNCAGNSNTRYIIL